MAAKKSSRFLKKALTPKRIINAGKLVSSYYLGRWFGGSRHSGMPMAVSIEPTTSCNLRCPQCPSGLREFSRDTGMLDLNLYKKTIDQLESTLIYLTLYFQGEPFLNKNFLKMVEYAAKSNIYTTTSSNAHYFTPEVAENTVMSGLNKIIISIDGATQDTYGKYRIGGKLQSVLDGTKELVQQKKKHNSKFPHIVWQFIVFSHNEHQLEEVKEMAADYGVDELSVKTAQVYDFEQGSELIPNDEEYSRYVLKNGKYVIKNELLNHCWRLWHACVITWDGLVAPCCFDKDAKYRFGDLKTTKFQDVWRSESYNMFRNKVLSGRKNIDICQNCTEGTKVWV
jgi:radical SAM protein with 4Fe4S-binding SPASM domain